MRFLYQFFHQKAPHGPIRDILGPFWILAIFHGDILNTKLTPRSPIHRGVLTLWYPLHMRVTTPWCPIVHSVVSLKSRNTLWFPEVQSTGNSWLSSVRNTWGTQLPGVPDTGELRHPSVPCLARTQTTPRKINIIWNGPWTSLMGQGGAVWWERKNWILKYRETFHWTI